jgi:hypothetical protein
MANPVETSAVLDHRDVNSIRSSQMRKNGLQDCKKLTHLIIAPDG